MIKSIAFFETKPWEEEYLRKRLKGRQLYFSSKPFSSAFAMKSDCISVFIYSKLDSAAIKKLPKLSLVATRSTGFDHVDVEACRKMKIPVCNVPYYGENTVAEHTFALILSISRNVHKSYMRTLRDDFSIDGLKGFDLKDKTIGIMGGGHIGMHVARIALGFGMKVIVCDHNPQYFLAEVMNFSYVPFEELLRNSDIISLHVPHTKQTHHLINRKSLKMMKKGAILINTSRGGIVDTDALLEALENKTLSGTGLDVIEGEELIKDEHELLGNTGNPEKFKQVVRDHRIFRMENVVFTPHNAFNSSEALQRVLDATIENILNEGKCNNVWQ